MINLSLKSGNFVKRLERHYERGVEARKYLMASVIEI